MKKTHEYRSQERKLSIVCRHLLEKVSVSNICDAESIVPPVIYRWQQELFGHGAGNFEQYTITQ